MILQVIIWAFAVVGMRFAFKRSSGFRERLVRQSSVSSSSQIDGNMKTSIVGDTRTVSTEHPVIGSVIKRWKEGSKPGRRSYDDKNRIALCIEGGGMRGCVAAGATAALHFLGLNDAVDIVYGSSAGAMVGSYFISRQFAGVQIYHDVLPFAGSVFINKVKLLSAAGIPPWVVTLILRRQQSKSRLPATNDVFNLDYLLDHVMKGTQKLDWSAFERHERLQPLRIIACSVVNLCSVALSRKKGNYCDLLSLLACIRASMSVPGITGPMMALPIPSNGITKDSFLSTPYPILPATGWWTKRSTEHFPLINRDNLPHQNDESFRIKRDKIKNLNTIQKIQKFLLRIAIRNKIRLQYLWRHSSSRPIHEELLTVPSKTKSGPSSGRLAMSLTMSPATALEISTPISITTSRKIKPTQDIVERKSSTIETKKGNEVKYEGLVDACICEPIPYRSAVDEGATHLIVLRTKPDPCQVNESSPGVFERFIARRFFRKYQESAAARWVMNMEHQRIYREDIGILNLGAKGHPDGVPVSGRRVHLLPIAPLDCPEVDQLELDRAALLQGMRAGALRVFDLFCPAMNLPEDLSTEDLTNMVFPLSILENTLAQDTYDNGIEMVTYGMDAI